MNKWPLKTILIFTTVLSFIFITYAIYIISLVPASYYELSIYQSTPIVFWVAVVIGLANGIILIVLRIYDKIGQFWIFGAIELVLCNCLLISLYALRGYSLYLARGDAATYIGLAIDVTLNGFISEGNFYPLISILISQINQITAIPIISISVYFTTFLYILYIAIIYIWSKSLLINQRFVFSSLLVSVPLFFAWFFTSIYYQLISVLLLPLLFYLLQKSFSPPFRLLCILFLITYTFMHPLTSLLVIILIIIFFLLTNYCTFETNHISPISITLVMVALIAFLLWVTNQYLILKSITIISMQLIGILDTPTTSAQAISYMNKLGILDTAKAVLVMNFDELIYYMLSFICVYFIIFRENFRHSNILIVCILFVVGSLFLLGMFFLTKTHVPDRLLNLNFNMILAIPIVAYLLLMLQEKSKLLHMLVIGSIIVASFFALLSLYPSPLTMRPNDQTCISDLAGMEFIISKKNIEIKTATILTPVFRYADLLYGKDYRLSRNDLYNDLILPDHFGFCTGDFMPIDNDRYLILTEFDKVSYIKIWPNINRFNKCDFHRLDNSLNIDKIYSNGQLVTRIIYKYPTLMSDNL